MIRKIGSGALRKISPGALLNIGLALMLVGLVGFGFFHLRRQPPPVSERFMAPGRPVPNEPPVKAGSIYGPPGSPLSSPLGLAVAPDGRVFVADSDNNQVQVFGPGGEGLTRWGKPGRGKGEFQYPVSVLIRNRRVYVADLFNGRVQIFDMEGGYLGVIPDPGKHGDLKIGPLALAQDRDGNLYVATQDHNVAVFDRDDNFVRRTGRRGRGSGELEYPFGVAVDGRGRLWVADSNNGRVHRYEPDGRLGLTIGGFLLPRGLAVDDRGRLYVVDMFQHQVIVADLDGRRLFTFGEPGAEDGKLDFPNAVAVGPRGRVYVADRENNRVSVWRY